MTTEWATCRSVPPAWVDLASVRRIIVPLAGLLCACSPGQSVQPVADIARVADVKGSFGPEFAVTELPTTGIDPRILATQTLPPGLTFDPADCARFAAGEAMPADLKGNMAAVSAEGRGNRFITVAMETSAPIPLVAPTPECAKVSFAGGPVRGAVEVVGTPDISDVATLGVHRILQTTATGSPQTGEVYSYRAQFGNYQVIVTANPLVVPDRPVAPVDTARAEKLLTDAVAAIRQGS